MSLIVFPAIDLKNGQVVRLAEGDMARATVYGDNPAHQAELFAQAGAQHLHVVDLD
ncbi:MAG: 1-(5-phosphoribosyl)-5-((5-phosphoribosylamino)methylideneamino)imidazole-4-carboxamide isomerase, partial [Alphaproteobacteria bacterium]|nr:1-(5-phosphoribosyl)-5-((5-phosphoribosylamino)methylideneamino)imidazole-4-carboxamide isomerase [Alphaproteobacteria bacterium]